MRGSDTCKQASLSDEAFMRDRGGGRGAHLSREEVARLRVADQHHARGYSQRKQGNFHAAIEEYSRAIALDPRHFKALFNRGFSQDKVCPFLSPSIKPPQP